MYIKTIEVERGAKACSKGGALVAFITRCSLCSDKTMQILLKTDAQPALRHCKRARLIRRVEHQIHLLRLAIQIQPLAHRLRARMRREDPAALSAPGAKRVPQHMLRVAVLGAARQTGTVKVTAPGNTRLAASAGPELRPAEPPGPPDPGEAVAYFKLAAGPAGGDYPVGPLLTVEARPRLDHTRFGLSCSWSRPLAFDDQGPSQYTT